MAIHRLLDGAAFEPEAIKAMTDAYEEALRTLRLTDRNDPVAEMIARKIIRCANTGEDEPALGIFRVGPILLVMRETAEQSDRENQGDSAHAQSCSRIGFVF